jgi:hypothetical protein
MPRQAFQLLSVNNIPIGVGESLTISTYAPTRSEIKDLPARVHRPSVVGACGFILAGKENGTNARSVRETPVAPITLHAPTPVRSMWVAGEPLGAPKRKFTSSRTRSMVRPRIQKKLRSLFTDSTYDV